MKLQLAAPLRTARRALAGALFALALAPAADAAAPQVPLEIAYQGVLVDATGAPRTGNVDLTLRIYDAATGGALVYKQVFTAVALDGGVFSVRLGPTGSATDSPANPLTTSLAGALGGDVGPTGPSRFLSVTVGTEGSLARTQILASPYALRAVDADNAQVAETANDVTAVNGLPASVLNQLYEFGNSDNTGAPNTDPFEGTVDTDGDGGMNFVDPDNDNDGLLDGQEIADGSHVNVTTPSVTSIVPSPILALAPSALTVTGASLHPTMTVTLGGAPVPAVGVTANSATVTPAPGLPVGSLALVATLTNGEDSAPRNVSVIATPPAGETVQFTIGTQPTLSVKGAAQILLGGEDRYGISKDGDGAIELVSAPFDLIGNPGGGHSSQIAVSWGPNGEVMGLRCLPVATGCQPEVVRDGDGDDALGTAGDVSITGPIAVGSAMKLTGAALGVDASGRIFAGYGVTSGILSGSTGYGTLHDRNGDGDFADAGESVSIETAVTAGPLGSAAVDASGRLLYAYTTEPPGGGGPVSMRLAYDFNGDGDFADAGELTTATTTSTPGGGPCGGVAFDASGRLAVALGSLSAPGLRVLRDLNGDGDFVDAADSSQTIGVLSRSCSIGGGGPLAVSGGTNLYVDRNDDGDFNDATEIQTILADTTQSRSAVRLNSFGRAWVGGSFSGPQTVLDPL